MQGQAQKGKLKEGTIERSDIASRMGNKVREANSEKNVDVDGEEHCLEPFGLHENGQAKLCRDEGTLSTEVQLA